MRLRLNLKTACITTGCHPSSLTSHIGMSVQYVLVTYDVHKVVPVRFIDIADIGMSLN